MKKDPNHWERYREIGFRIAYCRKYQKMTQEELRKLYKERLTKEKQCCIAKEIKIDGGVLSRFKNGKIDLYPELFEKLENYLTK